MLSLNKMVFLNPFLHTNGILNSKKRSNNSSLNPREGETPWRIHSNRNTNGQEAQEEVLSPSNRGIKMRWMSSPRDRLVRLDKLFKGNTARSANVWNLKQEIPLLGINFYRNMEKHRLKKNKKKSSSEQNWIALCTQIFK